MTSKQAIRCWCWGDEAQGLAVVKADAMQELAVSILKGLGTLGGGLHEK